MNLQRVPSNPDPSVKTTVYCQSCQKMVPADRAYADLDGPPYAYYLCVPCVGDPCPCVTYGITCEEHAEFLPYWHR